MNRRRLNQTLAAAAATLPACAALPVALAYADADPFADFTSAVGGSSEAAAVASSLDSTLSDADPGLAAELQAYVAHPSTIPAADLTFSPPAAEFNLLPAPGLDDAFGVLLPGDATTAQIAEADALDVILYQGLAAQGQTGTITALDTEAGILTSVVAPINDSPYTLFAESVGNPTANAAVLDANMFAENPGVAAAFAAYVENPSTIPSSALDITGVPSADNGFAELLPANATAAQLTEATELDNLLYQDYWAPMAAEAGFYVPVAQPSPVPLVGDDPFSDFAINVGSPETQSQVYSLDLTLIHADQPLAAVLNGYIDGTLSLVANGLQTAPAGDDPFVELLPAGTSTSSANYIEAEDLDNALYTGLLDSGHSNLAGTLATDASTPISSSALAPDPFTDFSALVSADVTPPGVANLDAMFADTDPTLAETFAGYVLDPSSIPTTDPAAPSADQPFADLLATASAPTTAQTIEATNLDNVLYADDPSVAGTLGSYATYLTDYTYPTYTAPAPSVPVDPITLSGRDFSTTLANAHEVFSAAESALSTLFSADTAAIPGNLATALEAAALLNAPSVIDASVTAQTLGGVSEATLGGRLFHAEAPVPIEAVHTQVYSGLLGEGFSVPGGTEGDVLAALDNFGSSPLSGVIIGFLGPVLSPEVALLNSIDTAVADITAGDPSAALTALADAPVNTVNAFFNGATLNLDAFAPALESFVSAGDNGGESIATLNLALGGLFSPGSVVDGVGGVENGVGGSILNSVGMELLFHAPDDDAGGTVTITGDPVGPIAALDGLANIVGEVFNGNLLVP
ncbi:outer membrane porin GjpA [Mycobacterium sp.]|uniref:outer membrane porin GjpA n=1 Tax=Mycobacterium sp. TaxID=1785 RepID=UPI00126C7414|nr:outer membrane porin GjpA [Mycobacterium sp.]KAA8958643.1 MAG: hypothetical protein F6Q13_15345 [Mycobacterium sp.]